MRYTFSDEEMDVDSDALSVRRSARNSGRETPAVPAAPTVTASGRQVRSRAAGAYGESLVSGQTTERASPATGDYVRSDASEEPQATNGRSTRAAATKAADALPKKRKHSEKYNSSDEMDDDEDDATSWDGGDEDENDQMDVDDDDDQSDEASDEEDEQKSLVISLKYPKGTFNPSQQDPPPTDAQSAEPSAQEPQPAANTNVNGTSSPIVKDATVTSIDQNPPKVDLPLGAPTPPYTAQEEPKPLSDYPVLPKADTAPAHHALDAALPAPKPVASWQ